MKKLYSLFALLSFCFGIWGQNITEYDPEQGATNADPSQKLILTFDQEIYFNAGDDWLEINLFEDDINIETWYCWGGEPDPGVAKSIDGLSLEITPGANLLEGSNYYITIDNGAIVGFSGIDNSESNNWRFSVSSSLIYYPEQNATDVDLNVTMTLTFANNISFNPSRTATKIQLFNNDATLIESWTCAGGRASSGASILDNVLSINPTSPIDEGVSYYITIDDGAIVDFSGIDNSEGNNWRFTAITYPPVPTVYSPDQGETGVSPTPSLQLTFNMDVQFIDPPSEYKILLRQGGTTIDEFIVSPGFVDGNLAFDGDALTTDRLTITPYTSPLETNTEYHVIIPSGLIESIPGAPFSGITTSSGWSFTTIGEPAWETGYPLTRNLSPTSVDMAGQTDQSGTYYYVVTASATAPTAAQIKAGQDETGTPTTYTSGSGAMTGGSEFAEAIDISNYGLYAAETTYYIHLIATDGVYSLDSPIETTSFTTLERTAPVNTFTPADGTTDVSTSTPITISFDEPVRMTNGTIIDDSNVASLVSFYIAPSTPQGFTATINAEKTLITITPDAALTQNTTYGVSIFAVEDYYGNQQATSSSAEFTTSDYIIWDGETSSAWLTDANWDAGFVEGISVIIPSTATAMPVISTDVTVGNIVIEAGASLEITSAGSLTVNETITLESSTSDPGNASLIDHGHTPVSVNGSDVLIYQQINASNRTYNVSSAVSGATKSTLGIDNAIGSYDNTTDSWNWMGNDDPLTSGTGYALRTSTDLTFTGNINSNASYGVMLTRTDGAGYGWNFIGNPYPAGLNWNEIGLKTNIDNAYWIFLNDATNYGIYATYSQVGGGTYGLDNIIPSNQGFYVKVTEGYASGSITMPKAALEANNKSVLKGSQISYPKINLAGVSGIYEDETIIAFADIAEDGDDTYDASKRFSTNSNLIQLFSYENSESYAINCKSELQDNLVVPLGYSIKNTGSYSIKVIKEEGIFNNYKVLLEDKYAKKMTDLAGEDPYTFSATKTGKITDQFALHFIDNNTATDINNGKVDTNPNIYAYSKTIYVSGENLNGSTYEIYSTNGRLLKNGALLNEDVNIIHTNLDGLFVVKIINKNESFAKKVLLK